MATKTDLTQRLEQTLDADDRLHNRAAEGAFVDAVRLAQAGDTDAADWLRTMAPDFVDEFHDDGQIVEAAHVVN